MLSRRLSSVVCPLFRESLCTIRSIRHGLRVLSAPLQLFVRIFCTSHCHSLKAWPRGFRALTSITDRGLSFSPSNRCSVESAYIIGISDAATKAMTQASRSATCWRACFLRSFVRAASAVAAIARMVPASKMLVFLLRCSNRNAVFAILRTLDDNRHSLMARRAAWRRSERRRRSRRRKKAPARQSAGRRSNPLAASSLRLD